MKIFKALVLVGCISFLLLSSSTVHAGPRSYIGLFLDAYHCSNVLWYSAPYTIFTVWVWIYPGDNGLVDIEYDLTVPSWLIKLSHTKNPLIIINCDEEFFCTVDLCACRSNEWLWISQNPFITLEVKLGDIFFAGWGETIKAHSCLAGNPEEHITLLSNITINYMPPSVESASWGAVKSLYGSTGAKPSF